MKKILLGSVALAAMLASPAMAADYAAPRRAATFAPAAPSWTGIYIGGNIGGVWGNTDPGFIAGCNADQTNTATTLLSTSSGFIFTAPVVSGINTCYTAGLSGPAGANAAASATVLNQAQAAGLSSLTQSGTQPFHNRGVIGGGQIGFNYQYQWAVFGLEADFQAWNPKGTSNVSGVYPNTLAGSGFFGACNALTVPGTVINGSTFAGCQYGFNESSNGKWLTTLRGKVGAVWNNWMLYGTVGVAWGRMTFTSNFADNSCAAITNTSVGAAFGVGGCNLASGFTTTQTRVGFVGGGGLSYMLTHNLIASVEYLRVELNGFGGDTVARTTVQGCLLAPGCTPAAGPAVGTYSANFHYDTSFIENIVRFKLDYKL
jgi:outer membrane immunogenic protein